MLMPSVTKEQNSKKVGDPEYFVAGGVRVNAKVSSFRRNGAELDLRGDDAVVLLGCLRSILSGWADIVCC